MVCNMYSNGYNNLNNICIILRGVTCIRWQRLYRCIKVVVSGGMRLRNILITKCKIINYNDSDSMHHVLVKLLSHSQKK